ncbi:MAG: secondary thiamine-phosphate synthase enzyme YjbQ [Phycisphaeraceae bacterium]|nr:secondary thiamine-phosphate synthase enzyme YjbQ [Phycisphaeraceae bacterium]
MLTHITIPTPNKGLYDITNRLRSILAASDPISEGLCTLFIQHTSASLLIQENADPSARADLEAWIDRFVPENDPAFTHRDEGPDDMPSHIKSAVTPVSLGVPIADGALALGRWQGIYVWEHRRGPVHRERRVLVHVFDTSPR